MSSPRLIKITDCAPGIVKNLDSPSFGCPVALPLKFRGWVLDRSFGGSNIFIVHKDDTIAKSKIDVHRPALAKKYSLSFDEKYGFSFEADISLIFNKNFTLNIFHGSSSNQQHLWALDFKTDYIIGGKETKKMFFMHIAKTGGSTINNWITNHYSPLRCRPHIEAFHLNPSTYNNFFSNKDFLSGHVPLDVAISKNYIDENFKTMTVLRNPKDQLISHLSWVKRLGFPENANEFKSHPLHIQRIAIRLNEATLTDFLQSMTSEEKDLFDNVQTRYLANAFHRDLKLNDIDVALDTINSFDFIGITERLSELALLIESAMDWKQSDILLARKNVSKYKISIEEINGIDDRILNKLLQFDELIYAATYTRFISMFSLTA